MNAGVGREARGLLARFGTPNDLLRAASQSVKEGYREIEAFTPFMVEGLAETLGYRKTKIPSVVFCFALFGALTGYALPYYCNAFDYPWNIGGRPLNSFPAFFPIMFELAILF